MQSLPSALTFPIILVAGIIGQKLAAKLWTQVFDSDPPDTGEQEVRWIALFGAAIIEGTMYKLLRMLADRGLRQAVFNVSGNWPGQHGDGE